MQTTVRTTLRIRKDLLDLSRSLAFKKGATLQEIINNTLALGFAKVSNIESAKEAMNKIDKFRSSLSGKNVNLAKLLKASRVDQK